MRLRSVLAGLALVSGLTLHAACSGSSDAPEGGAATTIGGGGAGAAGGADQGAGAGPIGGGTGAGEPVGCHGRPDDFCDALGASPEACTCPDCAKAAHCTGRCVDDGACDLKDGAEDCTCADCWGRVAACPPKSVGCTDAEECTLKDDCTCPKCAKTPRCTGTCVDNGSCVPYLEGCACADCEADPACGGAPPKDDAGPPVVDAGGAGGANAGGANAGGANAGGVGGQGGA